MFKIPMLRPSKTKAALSEEALAKSGPDCNAVGCEDDLPAAEAQPLPEVLTKDRPENKTPAQWAYERLILYIQNFEKHLDDDHEIGLGLVSGGAGVLRISGMGYFAPDLVTFYGTDEGGRKTQLVQHVSQLNVMLKAAPKLKEKPARIGFDLTRQLEEGGVAAEKGA